MAAIDTSRTYYGSASQTGNIKSIFAGLTARFVAWNEIRVTRKELYSLSDRELEDIGLSRGDMDTLRF